MPAKEATMPRLPEPREDLERAFRTAHARVNTEGARDDEQLDAIMKEHYGLVWRELGDLSMFGCAHYMAAKYARHDGEALDPEDVLNDPLFHEDLVRTMTMFQAGFACALEWKNATKRQLSKAAQIVLVRLQTIEAGAPVEKDLLADWGEEISITEAFEELEKAGLVYFPEDGGIPRLTSLGESA